MKSVSELVRPTVCSMTPYVPGEQPQGGGFIKLNTNENPYPPSPRVIEAVRAAATDDLRLYPDPMANELRRKAAEIYDVSLNNILVGNGSDELLTMITRACVGPGARVVYPTPTYSLYDTLITIQDGEIVHVPYGSDSLLPQGLAIAGAALTIVCHPNAPTGIPVSIGDLDDLAASIDGVLLVDEAYVDFADESALPLIRRHDNVLVLRTFSKSFSLAGLRVGLLFGAPPLVSEILKVKDSYNLNRLSIRGATAALEDYAWMKHNVAKVRATRERLIAELRQRGFVVPDSQTNFVLARRPGVDQYSTYVGLKEQKVLVRYFATPELSDALRISIGTDAEIDRLLTALDSVL